MPSVVNAGFFSGSAGDWGGASRVLYTSLRILDRARINPLVLLPGEGPITQELDKLDIEYVIWGPLTEPGRPFAYAQAMWRTLSMLRRWRIEVMHVNHSNSWRPAELFAAWLARVPIVTHYHTTNLHPAPIMSLSTAIVAVSEYVARRSPPFDVPRSVIHNPVDIERFGVARSIRSELGYSADEVLVTFVGQIREIKGIRDFIEMGKQLPHARLRFLIAGECRDPQVFEGSLTEPALIDAFGGDTRFRHLGYVKKVEDIYASSDIIVMPSRWEEPLGLVCLEAGACGKPVIATRSGGIPEIVRDGETGLLVDIGDVAALVRQVALLVDAPTLRQRLGSNARSLVSQRFGSAPVRAFESLLEAVAKGDAVGNTSRRLSS